jgi:hypothetical protein
MTPIISIDPGSVTSGVAWNIGDEWGFIDKASIDDIKKLKFTPIVLIEDFDYFVKAGHHCHETAVTIGILYEFFKNKGCQVYRMGRKGNLSNLPEQFSKDDKGVKNFCESMGFKKVKGKLESHAFQALGQLLIYRRL